MSERTASWGAVAAILGMFLLVEGLWIVGAPFVRATLDLPAGKIMAGFAFLIVGTAMIVGGVLANRGSPRPPTARTDVGR